MKQLTTTPFHLDYGLIGNGQISALISEQGSLDWLCLPRLDGPSVFARLLDPEQGGSFAITAADPAQIQQRYQAHSNVLETHFETPDYAFKIVDFIPCPSLAAEAQRPLEVHRQLIPLRGTPHLRLHFDPRLNYALETPEISLQTGCLRASGEYQDLFLHSTLPLQAILDQDLLSLEHPAYCVLSPAANLSAELSQYSQSALEATTQTWQNWVAGCDLPAQYQQEVIRSALALKLHIFTETGASIAATTTSVPEIHGSVRCWDYRFCWIRDSFFLFDALWGLGQVQELAAYQSFVQALCKRGIDKLQPLYGISGATRLEEVQLTHLRGAADSGLVRVGNAAYTHKQYDIYGEIILSLYPLFFDTRLQAGPSEREAAWQLIPELVSAALDALPHPDSGIWEFRNTFLHHTFSKLMIWVALDRGAKIAATMQASDLAEQWQQQASELQSEILSRAWNENEKFFAMSYGAADADAAVLLMPIMGLIDPLDPRFVSTVQVYKQRLMQNGHVFRYLAADDFGLPECAFNFCTFWMIHALYLTGEQAEARALFEKMLRAGNHLGLFSEDTQPESGQMYGNFPQTYTHVGIIQAARLLSGSPATYAQANIYSA